jgi:hypothetical protein
MGIAGSVLDAVLRDIQQVRWVVDMTKVRPIQPAERCDHARWLKTRMGEENCPEGMVPTQENKRDRSVLDKIGDGT